MGFHGVDALDVEPLKGVQDDSHGAVNPAPAAAVARLRN